jgi:hypothetical protein
VRLFVYMSFDPSQSCDVFFMQCNLDDESASLSYFIDPLTNLVNLDRTHSHTHTHTQTHTHTHTQIQAHRHTRRHTHTVYCSHNLPTHIYAIPRTCLLLSLFVLRTHAIPRTCIPLPPFFNLNACNLPLSIFVLQTHTIPRIASPLFHAHTHTRTHSRTQSAPLIMCATHTGNFKDVHASSCHGPPSNPPPGHPAYLKSMSVGSNTSGTSR